MNSKYDAGAPPPIGTLQSTPLPAQTRQSMMRKQIDGTHAHLEKLRQYAAEQRPHDYQLIARIDSIRLEFRLLLNVIAVPVQALEKYTQCVQCAKRIRPDEPFMKCSTNRNATCLSCHITEFGQLTDRHAQQLDAIINGTEGTITTENHEKATSQIDTKPERSPQHDATAD